MYVCIYIYTYTYIYIYIYNISTFYAFMIKCHRMILSEKHF